VTNGSLTIGAKPFRAVGFDMPWLNSNCNGNNARYPTSVLRSSLAALKGTNTLRAWFFQRAATANAGTPQATRDWSGFDESLKLAHGAGLKVIVTLSDYWDSCDSGTRGPEWFAGGYADASSEPLGTTSYRQYVADVVARYKSDTTILAWQLMNEPDVCADGGQATLVSWANDMTSLVRSIDPNHLVDVGSTGGCTTTSPDDYATIEQATSDDLCERHIYNSDPMAYGLAGTIATCSGLGKPVYVGEVGFSASASDRVALMQTKLDAEFAAGVAGEVWWAYGYDIFRNDPLIDLLASYATP
jgi:endo-1,4-beta-mannosidase